MNRTLYIKADGEDITNLFAGADADFHNSSDVSISLGIRYNVLCIYLSGNWRKCLRPSPISRGVQVLETDDEGIELRDPHKDLGLEVPRVES